MPFQDYAGSCVNCGEHMMGDGYKVVLHCPYTTQDTDVAPDSNPIYCNEVPDGHTT